MLPRKTTWFFKISRERVDAKPEVRGSRAEAPRLNECRIRTPRSDDRCPGRVAIYSHPCSLSLSLSPSLRSHRCLGCIIEPAAGSHPVYTLPSSSSLSLSLVDRPFLCHRFSRGHGHLAHLAKHYSGVNKDPFPRGIIATTVRASSRKLKLKFLGLGIIRIEDIIHVYVYIYKKLKIFKMFEKKKERK